MSAQSAETNVTAKQEEYTKNEQCCVSNEYVTVWLELLGTKNPRLSLIFITQARILHITDYFFLSNELLNLIISF